MPLGMPSQQRNLTTAAVQAWKPRPALVPLRVAHTLASHRQAATQPLEADARPELFDQNLPVELIAPVAYRTLHVDYRDPDVFQGRASLVVGCWSSSSHSISMISPFMGGG